MSPNSPAATTPQRLPRPPFPNKGRKLRAKLFPPDPPPSLHPATPKQIKEWTRFQIQNNDRFAFEQLRWGADGRLLAIDPLAYGIGYAIGHGGTIAPDVAMHAATGIPHVMSTGIGPVNGHALGRYFSRPEVAEPLNRYVLPVVNHAGVPLLRRGWESNRLQPVRQTIRHNGLSPASTYVAATRAFLQTNPGRAGGGAALFGALISAPALVAGKMFLAAAAPTVNAAIRWSFTLIDARFHTHDIGEYAIERMSSAERPKRVFNVVRRTFREAKRVETLDPFECLLLLRRTAEAFKRDGFNWRDPRAVWRTFRVAEQATLRELDKDVSFDEAHQPHRLVVEVETEEPDVEFVEPPHAFLRRLSWREMTRVAEELLGLSGLPTAVAEQIRKSPEFYHLARRCEQFITYPDGTGNECPKIHQEDDFRGPHWYRTFRAKVSERTHSARWLYASTKPMRGRTLPERLQVIGEGEGTLGLAAALQDASLRTEIVRGTQRVLDALPHECREDRQAVREELCAALELVIGELPKSTMDDYRDARAILLWGRSGRATERKLEGLAEALTKSLIGPDRGMIVKYIRRGDADAVMNRLRGRAQLSRDPHLHALVDLIGLAQPQLARPTRLSGEVFPRASHDRFDFSRLDVVDGETGANQAIQLSAVCDELGQYVGTLRPELREPVVAMQSRPSRHPRQDFAWAPGTGQWGDDAQKMRTAQFATEAILGRANDGATRSLAKTLNTVLLTSNMTESGLEPIMGLETRIASVLIGHERRTQIDALQNVALVQLLTPESAQRVHGHIRTFRAGRIATNDHPEWVAAEQAGWANPWNLVVKRAERIAVAAEAMETHSSRRELLTPEVAEALVERAKPDQVGERVLPAVYEGLKPDVRKSLDEVFERDNGSYLKLTHQWGHIGKRSPHGEKVRRFSISDACLRDLVDAVFDAGLSLSTLNTDAFSSGSQGRIRQAMENAAPRLLHKTLKENGATAQVRGIVVPDDRIDDVADAIDRLGLSEDRLSTLEFAPETHSALRRALLWERLYGKRERAIMEESRFDPDFEFESLDLGKKGVEVGSMNGWKVPTARSEPSSSGLPARSGRSLFD